MSEEIIDFFDLPDEEFAERVGDEIENLIKQGLLPDGMIIEKFVLDKYIDVAVEAAKEKYNKEKGII